MSIELVEFSLPGLIDDVMNLLQMQARDKQIEFNVIKDKLPDRVISDPNRLRQILINVIGNAVKFTNEGSVQVLVESSKHNKRENHVELKFTVTDTGIGIPPEQRDKLFHPFTQADNSMARRFGGTGLGLFVSRRLAQLLGGNVILDDPPGAKGSRFVINIAAARADQKVKLSARSTEPIKEQIKCGKVLVVDDAADNRTLIVHYISRMGYESDIASTGREALEKATHGSFDLILMDLQMPEMDGFEALNRLKEIGYQRPVVALTAHAMKGDREKCLKAGFDGYLAKPIDRESLLQVLTQFIQPKGHPQPTLQG